MPKYGKRNSKSNSVAQPERKGKHGQSSAKQKAVGRQAGSKAVVFKDRQEARASMDRSELVHCGL